jgi:hypothetical protein
MASIKKTATPISNTKVSAPIVAAPKAAKTKAAEPAKKTDASTFSATDAAKRPAQTKALEVKIKASGLPAATQTKIMDRLKAAAPADFAREQALLSKAATGPNADRALTAYDKIQTIAASSPEAAKRLTPEIREALVMGVSVPRTQSTVGQEGVLGVKQAEEAATSLVAMPQEQYNTASKILGETKSGVVSPKADPMAEQALILKAVASRGERLKGSLVDNMAVTFGLAKDTEAQRGMAEITDFAKDIHGTARTELIRTTSAIDIESGNTSKTDPLALLKPGTDKRGDNDGLYQRFENTCGPTTAQMTRAEADPVFARALHKDGLHSDSATSPTAEQQRKTLNEPRFFNSGGQEVIPTAAEAAKYKADKSMPAGSTTVEAGDSGSRRAHEAYSQANTALGALKGVSDSDKAAVRTMLSGGTLTVAEQSAANAALTKLRAANGKAPTDADVTLMQTELKHGENGMRLDPALRDIATGGTRINYQATWVGNSGPTTATVDDMETRLRNGQDVPIRVGGAGGGHFMLTSDVRGKSPDRSLLVSDPYSGRTAWVKEADMKNPSSKWLNTQFGLGWPQITHVYNEK